jgi:short-chain 2-methylacyl-CoA dehydrogenase
MDFSLTEAEQDLADLCRDFAQREIATRAPQAWEEARCPTDLLREMGSLGLLGMLVPEEWGGIGMTTVGFVAAMEQLGVADQSVAAAWQAHVTIGSLPLLLFGDDAQRERWLRPLAEGRALGAFGLTEPDAGSDARGISTRAEPRDGGWVINGRKTFISNAGTDMSFGVTLLARTPTAEGPAQRYGTFVVEKDTPGFTMGPKMRGIGWKGLDTRELFFDDVWVADDHLVGDPELGLGQFLRTLEVGRISIAALSVSLTQAVLDLATAYAKERVQFGQPISSFQAVQFKLADIATELEAARWLTYRAASLRDAGEPFMKEAAMAKLKASRVAAWAASEAVQVHGGLGYMLESPVARFYCDRRCSRSARAPTRSSTWSSPAPWAAEPGSGGHHAPDGIRDVGPVGQPGLLERGRVGRGRGAAPTRSIGASRSQNASRPPGPRSRRRCRTGPRPRGR